MLNSCAYFPPRFALTAQLKTPAGPASAMEYFCVLIALEHTGLSGCTCLLSGKSEIIFLDISKQKYLITS